MENQYRLIKGYRELTQHDIQAMNHAKEAEENLLRWMQEELTFADPRWLAIARTDLQKGFMALGRAIARPEGY